MLRSVTSRHPSVQDFPEDVRVSFEHSRARFKVSLHQSDNPDDQSFSVARLFKEGRPEEYDSYTISGLSDDHVAAIRNSFFKYENVISEEVFGRFFEFVADTCEKGSLPEHGTYVRNRSKYVVDGVKISDVKPETLQDYLRHISSQRLQICKDEAVVSLDVPFTSNAPGVVDVCLENAGEELWHGKLTSVQGSDGSHRMAVRLADKLVGTFQHEDVDGVAEHLKLRGIEEGMEESLFEAFGRGMIMVFAGNNSLSVRYLFRDSTLLNFRKSIKDPKELRKFERQVLKTIRSAPREVSEIAADGDALFAFLEREFEVDDRIVNYRQVPSSARSLFSASTLKGIDLLVDFYESQTQRWRNGVHGLTRFELTRSSNIETPHNAPDKLLLHLDDGLGGIAQFQNPHGGTCTFLLGSTCGTTQKELREEFLSDLIKSFREDPLLAMSNTLSGVKFHYSDEKSLEVSKGNDPYEIGSYPYVLMSEPERKAYDQIYDYCSWMYGQSVELLTAAQDEKQISYFPRLITGGYCVPLYMNKDFCLRAEVKRASYAKHSRLNLRLKLEFNTTGWFTKRVKTTTTTLLAPRNALSFNTFESLMIELYDMHGSIHSIEDLLESSPVTRRNIRMA